MRLKFNRSVSYNGTDIEAGETHEVDERWAAIFIRQGRAVPAEGETAPASRSGLTTADLVQHADPAVPVVRGGKAKS